jgi:Fe-Mn family superoxide dismutase
MEHKLPSLPYRKDALEPFVGEVTIDVHELHHHECLARLLRLVDGRPEAGQSLEQLIRTASGDVHDYAAEVWNHEFYWKSLRPGGSQPTGRLLAGIEAAFGSFQVLQRHMLDLAAAHFGPGWLWLFVGDEDRLQVAAMGGAGNPLRDGDAPLVAIDLWEHAYYLDYLNERKRYVRGLIEHLLDWGFAAENLRRALQRPAR